MTFINLIFTPKIIIPQLFLYDLKLSILSDHIEHLKGLVSYYVLPLLFTILKSLHPISQPTCWEKMTSVWEKLVIYLETVIHLGTVKYLETAEYFETAKRLEISMLSISERPSGRRVFWALWGTSYLEHSQSILLRFWYWYNFRGLGWTS